MHLPAPVEHQAGTETGAAGVGSAGRELALCLERSPALFLQMEEVDRLGSDCGRAGLECELLLGFFGFGGRRGGSVE